MKGRILFKERQSFVGTWMWYLVIGICLLSLGATTFSFLIGRGTEAVIGLIIVTLVTGTITSLLYRSKLEVQIDSNNVYYRFVPFVNSEHSISKEDVKEIYVRNYKPIWEYGGWGYRVRPGKGKALIVSGKEGLQIIFQNGKKLLLGTQKSESLKYAVQKLKENWSSNG
ncbi:MAG: hypothetical protein HRT61_06400 [Ekhidna sp.]|nr:hypothetical protein [Ekhidna sp.]